ncbi:MAG TPA: methyltransferase domain-containing protein [Candidatus Limnocylindrales bacterium]|nr:methyltransferase domain-containing protein [Candidatus Limnocylindrales bacterium]
MSQAQLDQVYATRFAADAHREKDRLWREVVPFLARWIPRDAAVIDVACDRGYFIRHVEARERWATDIRDLAAEVGQGITFVQSDGLALAERVPLNHFDVVFISNYLEHLGTPDAVIEQLNVARRLLRGGGHLIVLQPNVRFTGPAYWDFIDHRVALTDRSLVEACALAGLQPEVVIPRFLPYTTKSRLPQHPLLVRAYLRVPLVWRLLGAQTLLVAGLK